MKGVKHYKRDGTEWKGGSHKMPNGDLHSGKLFHLKELSKTAQKKARGARKKSKKS